MRPASHARYQATYWHNRLFNPNRPAAVKVLVFTPDWPHVAGYRSKPSERDPSLTGAN